MLSTTDTPQSRCPSHSISPTPIPPLPTTPLHARHLPAGPTTTFYPSHSRSTLHVDATPAHAAHQSPNHTAHQQQHHDDLYWYYDDDVHLLPTLHTRSTARTTPNPNISPPARGGFPTAQPPRSLAQPPTRRPISGVPTPIPPAEYDSVRYCGNAMVPRMCLSTIRLSLSSILLSWCLTSSHPFFSAPTVEDSDAVRTPVIIVAQPLQGWGARSRPHNGAGGKGRAAAVGSSTIAMPAQKRIWVESAVPFRPRRVLEIGTGRLA